MLQCLKIPPVPYKERERNENRLHIHTSTGSDGALLVEEVIKEAKRRNIGFMAVTDHDSLEAQEKAVVRNKGIRHRLYYRRGIERNFSISELKPFRLDFLGYNFDIHINRCWKKLRVMRERREKRAQEILDKIKYRV